MAITAGLGVGDTGFSIVDDGDMMAQLNAVLKSITADLKSTARGVELGGHTRIDGNSNAEIIEYQADQGRDIRTINRRDAEAIASAFAGEIEKRLAVALQKGREPNASGMSGAAYRAAMREYMARAIDKIDSQRESNGSAFKALSEKYRARKLEDFGFAEPILKATGQLIENLNPSTASREIKLRK